MLTISVSVVQTKRNILKLKLITSYLRSTMSQEILNINFIAYQKIF